MKLGTIYKKTRTGATQEWTIEVVGNKYRVISGQTDGKKITNAWTECFGKNKGKANETSDSEQAMKEAEAKRTLKLEKDYSEKLTSISRKRHFEPMLAAKWEDQKDKIRYPIYSQPKHDGVRCIVKHDGMWSRNGKPIVSAPHIFESLKSLFKSDTDLIFDGELYCDKLANDFNKIISLVKKTKPEVADLKESADIIQYHIYDLPSNPGTYKQRYVGLGKMKLPKSCVLVETNLIECEDDVDIMYENYMSAGYEGQILRADSLYENKRSKGLLKHKSFIDEEYEILEIGEGEGNWTGQAGYFVFERNGNRFKSNVKCNWDEGREIWKNRKKLIGKLATVKYFNLTPDGIPRFPYVINIDRWQYE